MGWDRSTLKRANRELHPPAIAGLVAPHLHSGAGVKFSAVNFDRELLIAAPDDRDVDAHCSLVDVNLVLK